MIKKVNRNANRQKRHKRIRNKISGTTEIPRLSVFRSNKHIYAQIIDDIKGHTVVSASSKDLGIENGGNAEAARKVGESIGKAALDAGVETVVFDRGGYLYHGRVKELAEGAREAGLKF